MKRNIKRFSLITLLFTLLLAMSSMVVLSAFSKDETTLDDVVKMKTTAEPVNNFKEKPVSKKVVNKKESSKKEIAENKVKEKNKESKKNEKKEIVENDKKDEEENKNKERIKEEEHNGKYTSTTDLNVRSQPSLHAEIIESISPSQKAVASKKANNDGVTWYKVKVNGIEGWASSAYLTSFEEYTKKVEEAKKQKEKQKKKNKASKEKSYQPNTFYFNGKAVPYKNGGRKNGQAVIDSHGGTKYASTWGGAEVFDGNDGLNTHFIGHNPGPFNGVWTADEFIVTDSSGEPFRYKVTRRFKLEDGTVHFGVDTTEGWSGVVNPHKGDMITVQTCLTNHDTLNWIIEAERVN